MPLRWPRLSIKVETVRPRARDAVPRRKTSATTGPAALPTVGGMGKARSGGLRDRGRAVCSDSRVRPECPELVESQTRLSGQVPPQKNKRESAETRSPTTYSFARDRRCSHL